MNAALNVRDYACAKVRRRLDSYVAGELSVDLSHEMLEHLERCPACAAELKAREGLRAAVRRASAVPEPREDFEAEVRSRIAKTPAPASGAAATLLLAASLLVATAAGTLFLVSRPAASPEASDAARRAKAFLFAALNHKNCTLRFEKWTKAPAAAPADLGPKLTGELKAAATAAAGRLPGYEPVTAHECSHAGEMVFHIVFRKAGSASPNDLVSVVATRPGSNLAAGVTLAGFASGGDRDGLAVVGANAPGGRLLFLVTDGNDADAMRMARLVLPAVSAAFVAR